MSVSFKLLCLVTITMTINQVGCGSSRESGSQADDGGADTTSIQDSDSGSVSDTTTGSDFDTSTSSNTDSDTYWSWNIETLDVAVAGICTDYNNFRLWAVNEGDVVICNGPQDDGGLVQWDGVDFHVIDLPDEMTGFLCEDVWGMGDEVWAWGYPVAEAGSAPVDEYWFLRRRAGIWVKEDVAQFRSCPYANCFIQGLFVDGDNNPHAVGSYTAIGNWGTPGERVVWQRDATTEIWTLASHPTMPEFTQLLGGLAHGGIVTLEIAGGSKAIVGGMEPTAEGLPEGEALIVEVGEAMVNLGYPAGRSLTWMEKDDDGVLFASTGFQLLRLDGSEWTELAGVTCDPGPWTTCWNTGAVDAAGNVYLAGGRGGFGDNGPDQWRLHRFDSTSLTEILEPCPGANPSCGISDLAIAGSHLFAIGRRDGECVLLHADLL